MRYLSVLLAVLCLTGPASADPLTINPADTVQSVVAAHKGKRVTLRLGGGEELSGVVRDVSERLVVLGELSGREFFDAAIPVDAIQAVIVRVQTR